MPRTGVKRVNPEYRDSIRNYFEAIEDDTSIADLLGKTLIAFEICAREWHQGVHGKAFASCHVARCVKAYRSMQEVYATIIRLRENG